MGTNLTKVATSQINMIKIILLLCLVFCFQYSFSQKKSAKETILKFAKYKNEKKKLDSLMRFELPSFYNNPRAIIKFDQMILKHSLKTNDLLMQGYFNQEIGTAYRFLGNSALSLSYHQKAIDIAEKIGNTTLLAFVKIGMGNVYKDRENWNEALKLYSSALTYAKKSNNRRFSRWCYMNIGVVYLNLNKLDSSLICLQNAYELDKYSKNDVYINLMIGSVHTKLGNFKLGNTYCGMALDKEKANAKEKQNQHQLILAYIAMAENFAALNQTDSCLVYSKKAIKEIGNKAYFYLSIKPAKMIATIYEKSNCDSTLKYAKIFQAANDSMFSKKANDQVQSISNEYDLRQKELVAEEKKEANNQKQNIQFALIALGIIVFVTLYLLLSRSFITSTQLIEFFGIMALLIVFEFLNLILHPLLEDITNHTPVIMLLALVCIAALLIPLHHKLEKWATNKLIKKNKEIRLANAKKTIYTLEEEELEENESQGKKEKT
jgi:tetratricopeptide (TPR) repeat protein